MRVLLLIALTAVSAMNIVAADFSLGAVFAISTAPYKSYDKYIMVSPFATYDGQRFYVQGAGAGVHLLKNEVHKISAGVSYFGLHFDPDDTDNRAMKNLNRRKSTMMADLTYSVITKVGVGKIKASRDVLGISDGYTVDACWQLPLIREKYTIMPSAGVLWSSREQADYYFGVSRGESWRSGLKRHTATSNFSPYLKLDAKYHFTDRWSAVASVHVNFLTGDVKDSPMVGKSATIGGAIGAQFTF